MKRRRKAKALFVTGEHGENRVWVWQRPESDSLYLGWYEETTSGERQRRSRSLGRIELAKAKREAEALATELRQVGSSILPAEITLLKLFELYAAERTPHKSRSAQDHDRRAMALFRKCWGEHRAVAELRPMDWDLYVRNRRSGLLAPSGREGQPVRDRVLEQDLTLLRVILHWAVQNELLDREPMAGCKVPREKNVNRPLLFEEEFEAMLAVADTVDPKCRLALLLAHETGHRSQSVRMLRWEDIDLKAGRIRWRAEHEKTRREHVVPVSERLFLELRNEESIQRGWLFPSTRLDDQPVGREHFEEWWRAVEDAAGLERVHGRGWHSLRRKFATERKTGSLTDLAYAGGWSGTQTLTKVYIQADEESVREVVTERNPIRRDQESP